MLELELASWTAAARLRRNRARAGAVRFAAFLISQLFDIQLSYLAKVGVPCRTQAHCTGSLTRLHGQIPLLLQRRAQQSTRARGRGHGLNPMSGIGLTEIVLEKVTEGF